MIEIIGFLAFALNVCGNLLLAWKRIEGWIIRIVSIVLWGIYAYQIWSPSMIANALTFFAINCYGWRKWKRMAEGHVGDCSSKPCKCGRFA